MSDLHPSGVALAYMVCASQRSGTQLMCTSLEDTGVAGRPPGGLFDLAVAAEPGGLSTAEIGRTVAAATGPNGVCGQRMFWNGLGPLLDGVRRSGSDGASDSELLERVLGVQPQYVWLRRDDKLRQAISFWRATAGPLGAEQWRKPTDPREPISAPVFDRPAIERFVKLLTEQDELWRRWFETNAIQPITVTYEALTDGGAAAVGAVLAGLGLDPSAAEGLQPPRVDRQADAHTERCVALYKGDG